MSNWGYGEEDGPEKWHSLGFPVAVNGKRQSPIDVNTEAAVPDPSLRENPLTWKYDDVDESVVNIENTGSSWKVNVTGKGSSLKGGPLDSEFELWQFHAHWGSEDRKGSEHTVDGKPYPSELHLVHWNKGKYSSPNIAADKPDGLAVLGILIEVGGSGHKEFQKIVDMLPDIKHKGDKVNFDKEHPAPDPAEFLPVDDKSYWTYEGSLTTPPLFESVIWTLFKKPMQVSQEQIEKMRAIMTCTPRSDDPKKCHVPMINNYRPPVPLGDRTLRQV